MAGEGVKFHAEKPVEHYAGCKTPDYVSYGRLGLGTREPWEGSLAEHLPCPKVFV